MNEQIEKLFDQALEEFKAENKYATVVIPDSLQRDFVGKFAELIVRECLEACSRANDIKHFVPPTQEQVVLSCMREIETTFWS
jgi:hypothetical protein